MAQPDNTALLKKITDVLKEVRSLRDEIVSIIEKKPRVLTNKNRGINRNKGKNI